jgi:hypothetical protein
MNDYICECLWKQMTVIVVCHWAVAMFGRSAVVDCVIVVIEYERPKTTNSQLTVLYEYCTY